MVRKKGFCGGDGLGRLVPVSILLPVSGCERLQGLEGALPWPDNLLVHGGILLSLVGLLAFVCRRMKRREKENVPAVPSGVPVAMPAADTMAETAAVRRTIRRLGPYPIERVLGKGSMGVVFLGRDESRHCPVAIKTLALSQAFDDGELAELKERFFREARSAGRLSHENIVAIHDAGEADGLAYIVMEYLSGGDLVPYTRPEHLLPLPEVLGIVAKIADALAYAHANNVVHRDIKPANVMYERGSARVRVADFGIARITDSSRTRTGMVLGTPSYMSPEQLSGKKIDGRSDLFSLGVMLYQLCCGKLPFVDTSMAKLMCRIAHDTPPDIRSINPCVPDALAAVIERALSKDSVQRYQNGDEMARAVRACLQQMPAQHPPLG